MEIVGIVCEYNPMHLGHLYQIKQIKKMYPDSIIVIVTNSCFTERGDISIVNKWEKTKVALDNNVDIVIELPFVYACQSADLFAKGAISLLNTLGVSTLVFGSETDNVEMFKKVVDTQLFNKDYDKIVLKYLDNGINYPTAMAKALYVILGINIDKPNDLLAISYIKEIIKNNYNIDYVSIKRTNSYHGRNIEDKFVNASLIREMILKGKDVSNYIAPNIKYYSNLSIEKAFPFLKYQVMINNVSNIQTVDEGIENRIKKLINTCYSWDELEKKIKTKRYTYNKINRMLLHILTNFTKEEANNISIDYLRILGFSAEGQKYLNRIKKSIDIPIITHYKKNISKVLDIEFRINSLYSYITEDFQLISDEYNKKPIIKK